MSARAISSSASPRSSGSTTRIISSILARHVNLGDADPYLVLGIERGLPFDEVRRHYHKLVADNHPDRLIARGVPEEFIAIATHRIAAINTAYETIERGLQSRMSGFLPDYSRRRDQGFAEFRAAARRAARPT